MASGTPSTKALRPLVLLPDSYDMLLWNGSDETNVQASRLLTIEPSPHVFTSEEMSLCANRVELARKYGS